MKFRPYICVVLALVLSCRGYGAEGEKSESKYYRLQYVNGSLNYSGKTWTARGTFQANPVATKPNGYGLGRVGLSFTGGASGGGVSEPPVASSTGGGTASYSRAVSTTAAYHVTATWSYNIGGNGTIAEFDVPAQKPGKVLVVINARITGQRSDIPGSTGTVSFIHGEETRQVQVPGGVVTFPGCNVGDKITVKTGALVTGPGSITVEAGEDGIFTTDWNGQLADDEWDVFSCMADNGGVSVWTRIGILDPQGQVAVSQWFAPNDWGFLTVRVKASEKSQYRGPVVLESKVDIGDPPEPPPPPDPPPVDPPPVDPVDPGDPGDPGGPGNPGNPGGPGDPGNPGDPGDPGNPEPEPEPEPDPGPDPEPPLEPGPPLPPEYGGDVLDAVNRVQDAVRQESGATRQGIADAANSINRQVNNSANSIIDAIKGSGSNVTVNVDTQGVINAVKEQTAQDKAQHEEWMDLVKGKEGDGKDGAGDVESAGEDAIGAAGAADGGGKSRASDALGAFGRASAPGEPGTPDGGTISFRISRNTTLSMNKNPFAADGPFGGVMGEAAIFIRRLIAWGIVAAFFVWSLGEIRSALSGVFATAPVGDTATSIISRISVFGNSIGVPFAIIAKVALVILAVALLLAIPLALVAAVTSGLPWSDLTNTYTAGIDAPGGMLGQALALANMVIPWVLLVSAPIYYFCVRIFIIPAMAGKMIMLKLLSI